MGLHNTKALVLRSINLSETDKLTTFLTEKYGKIKCVAKSARKTKSRFGAALEPMSFVHMIYFGKENQDLYRLNHCDIIQSFWEIREDFEKVYTGIYFNELIDILVPERERNPEIFRFLLDSFNSLSEEPDTETLCRLFELRIMALSGYAPRLNQCIVCQQTPDTECIGYSYNRSGVICESCSGQVRPGVTMRAGTWSYLKKLSSLDIKQTRRLKIPKNLECEIETVTHRMVCSHLGREPKSYSFIKKMAAL